MVNKGAEHTMRVGQLTEESCPAPLLNHQRATTPVTPCAVKRKGIVSFMGLSYLRGHFPPAYSIRRLSVHIVSEVLPVLPEPRHRAHERQRRAL